MASVYVTLSDVGKQTENGITQIILSGSLRSEVITSSGTSAAGALTANRRQVAKIVCATAVYATAGDTPTATTSNGTYCAAGIPEYIAMNEGDSIAVIDV